MYEALTTIMWYTAFGLTGDMLIIMWSFALTGNITCEKCLLVLLHPLCHVAF